MAWCMRVRMSLPYLICGFSMERVRMSFCVTLSYSRATRFVVPRSSAIRAQVRAVDRNQPLTRVRRMEEVVGESIGARRLSMSMLSGFAALALFLASVGIYG